MVQAQWQKMAGLIELFQDQRQKYLIEWLQPESHFRYRVIIYVHAKARVCHFLSVHIRCRNQMCHRQQKIYWSILFMQEFERSWIPSDSHECRTRCRSKVGENDWWGLPFMGWDVARLHVENHWWFGHPSLNMDFWHTVSTSLLHNPWFRRAQIWTSSYQ